MKNVKKYKAITRVVTGKSNPSYMLNGKKTKVKNTKAIYGSSTKKLIKIIVPYKTKTTKVKKTKKISKASKVFLNKGYSKSDAKEAERIIFKKKNL